MSAGDFGRVLVEMLDIDLDTCLNTYAATRYGVLFDGVDDYADCGDVAAHDLTSEVSVAGWVKYGGTGVGNAFLLIKQNTTGATGAAYGLGIFTGSGKAIFDVATVNNAWADNLSATVLVSGTWYHLAGTYKSGELKLYVNGVLENTVTTITGNLLTATGKLLIAKEDSWSVKILKGTLRDIRLYNRALTQYEVSLLAASGSVDGPSLISWWPMNEGSGATINDRGSAAAHGTLTSGPTWSAISVCAATGAVGFECYNTFKTCQDKANYTKGKKTYRFCNRGAPLPAGELVLPYISETSSAPTEINTKQGLARRASISVRLSDETDRDVDGDPYVATRAAASGTFWSRWFARNHNYSGRFARVKRMLATPDANGRVIYTTADPGFVTELYVIDSIRGPKLGEVSVTLKDPLKLADRVQVPVPTDGKLFSAITSSAATVPLTVGKGVQYDKYGYPCWVLIGKEIIKIDSRSTDTLNVNASGHAQFGSVAAAHSVDDSVQLCRVWQGAVFTDVVKNLLNDAGIGNTYIDSAQMTVENTNWLGTKYAITVCLVKPADVSSHLRELLEQSNSLMWFDVLTQKVQFKVNMPSVPSVTVSQFDESANFIDGSVSVEMLDAERLTLSAIYYALTSPVDNDSQPGNYLRADIYVDSDAESANEYNDRRSEVVRSRWFGSGNNLAMVAWAARTVNYRRDAQKKIKFSLDPKDSCSVGELKDVSLRSLATATGANNVTRVRITKVVDKGSRRECEGITTSFRNRYAFIAPNGYPNYGSASDAQRAYAFICNASGKMSNGDAGYLII